MELLGGPWTPGAEGTGALHTSLRPSNKLMYTCATEQVLPHIHHRAGASRHTTEQTLSQTCHTQSRRCHKTLQSRCCHAHHRAGAITDTPQNRHCLRTDAARHARAGAATNMPQSRHCHIHIKGATTYTPQSRHCHRHTTEQKLPQTCQTQSRHYHRACAATQQMLPDMPQSRCCQTLPQSRHCHRHAIEQTMPQSRRCQTLPQTRHRADTATDTLKSRHCQTRQSRHCHRHATEQTLSQTLPDTLQSRQCHRHATVQMLPDTPQSRHCHRHTTEQTMSQTHNRTDTATDKPQSRCCQTRQTCHRHSTEQTLSDMPQSRCRHVHSRADSATYTTCYRASNITHTTEHTAMQTPPQNTLPHTPAGAEAVTHHLPQNMHCHTAPAEPSAVTPAVE